MTCDTALPPSPSGSRHLVTVPSMCRRQCPSPRPCAACAHGRKGTSASASGRKRGERRKKKQAEVLYWPNFLPRNDFTHVAKICQPLSAKTRPELNSLAKGRLGMHLPKDSPAAEMLLGEETCKRIGRKAGRALLPGDYPVELRVYPVGSYMDWHVDEVMYRVPQYEMIYTIANTTDSETQWKADGELVSQWAEPNSLIAVRAGGPEHQVTRIGRGKRTILKFILTPTLDKTKVFEENLNREAFK